MQQCKVVKNNDILEKVTNRIVKDDIYPKTLFVSITFIIKSFVKYMFLAVIHGYEVNLPWSVGKFSLKYKKWDEVPEKMRKSNIFPRNAIGYTFHIVYRGHQREGRRSDGYEFRLSKRLREKLMDFLNTDNVYYLID